MSNKAISLKLIQREKNRLLQAFEFPAGFEKH